MILDCIWKFEVWVLWWIWRIEFENYFNFIGILFKIII